VELANPMIACHWSALLFMPTSRSLAQVVVLSVRSTPFLVLFSEDEQTRDHNRRAHRRQ